MPVARRQGGGHTARSVLVAVAGVAIALMTAFVIATLASNGDVEVRLGDDRFSADAREVLDDIIERGAPLGFNDPATFRRPIWLDNGGTDPDLGWVAIGAFLPDDPDCLVQWDRDSERYVAECDESLTFPRSGAGLRLYPVEVDDGQVYVNLQDTTVDD